MTIREGIFRKMVMFRMRHTVISAR